MKNPKEKTYDLNGVRFLTITGMSEKLQCNPLPHIRSLSSSVKVAARNAGIEFQGEATNHRFRHSFASNLIRAGADIKSVQLLMRHENVEITLNTYSHLLGADLEKAVNKIG